MAQKYSRISMKLQFLCYIFITAQSTIMPVSNKLLSTLAVCCHSKSRWFTDSQTHQTRLL